MKQTAAFSSFFPQFRNLQVHRGLLWGSVILAALIAFEVFNYSTTDFAMTDLIGDLRFANIRWATILAIAFCGIDLAGIARLFTPEKTACKPKKCGIYSLPGCWQHP